MDESQYFARHWNGFKWIWIDLRNDNVMHPLPGRLLQTRDNLFLRLEQEKKENKENEQVTLQVSENAEEKD